MSYVIYHAPEALALIILGILVWWASRRRILVAPMFQKQVPKFLFVAGISFIFPGYWTFAFTAAYVSTMVAADLWFNRKSRRPLEIPAE